MRKLAITVTGIGYAGIYFDIASPRGQLWILSPGQGTGEFAERNYELLSTQLYWDVIRIANVFNRLGSRDIYLTAVLRNT